VNATLHAGEYGGLKFGAPVGVIGKNNSAARAAQGFGRRAGNDIGMGQGRRMCAAGDEAGKMRHVDVEQGANFLGNGRHALEINFTGIGRTAGNQQFGGYVGGNFFDRVIIDQPGFALDAIVMGFEPTPGKISPLAVA